MKNLGELLLTLENGSRPKGGVTEIADGVPSLGGEHVKYDGGILWETPKHVTREFFDGMKRGHIKRGDILIVKDGATTGKTATVRENFPFREAAVNEHIFLLRTDQSVALSEYVGYFLFGPLGQQQILSNFHGSAIGGIAQDFVRNVYVPVPPLLDQKRIVKLLDETRKIIDLRSEADRITTSLIPSIFHEIFADGQSYVTKPLVELVDASRGISYGVVQRGNHFPGGVPLVRIGDFARNVFDPRGIVSVAPKISDQYKRTVLVGDELIVSIRGTVGRVAIVPNSAAGWNVAREVAVIPLLPGVSRRFLHSYLLSPFSQNFITNAVRGIAQRGINLEHLRRLPVPLPPKRLLDRFENLVTEARKLEDDQARSRFRFQALFQSMLYQAFRGAL